MKKKPVGGAACGNQAKPSLKMMLVASYSRDYGESYIGSASI